MSIATSVLSIVVFLAFWTAGIQRVRFTPVLSRSADHLGFSKRTFQAIGVVELVGGLGVMIGLASTRNSPLGIVNEVCAGGLFLAMLAAVVVHLRKGDGVRQWSLPLALGVVSLLVAVFRLA
jgi:uncharacterized membrane protein YphA (DoxX/SURF4 family)